MSTLPPGYQSARRDFRQARLQAVLQEVFGRLTGRSTRLLSYEEVAGKLRLSSRTDRGIRPIPVRAIVGSVGRYTDFTRTFLPRQAFDETRWARVKALAQESPMAPIEVYQVGEAYFVLDGNHRVSIARQAGMEAIDASVIEVQTPVRLEPDIQPDDLILKAEYAEFLALTRLAENRPNVAIELTAPGGYRKFLQQIEIECLTDGEGECPSLEQAALAWYENTYLPVAEALAAQGLLRWFPGRTEADLVLWISERRQALEQELGWAVRPEAAVADLAVAENTRVESQSARTGAWRQAHLPDRYLERLFRDILVPLSGEEDCWGALHQALAVAAREDARLHGLHVVQTEGEKTSEKVAALRSRFEETCARAAVAADFHVERGPVARRICERARLADLVVLNTIHPPGRGLKSLRSGLRTLIGRCTRPLLATCCNVTPMDRALLAFDGSPKSKEALFVAAYLAEEWLASLTVVTLAETPEAARPALEYARAYLELHEIQAEYLSRKGPLVETLHALMDERETNILLMGGYRSSPLEEAITGSLVDLMLQVNHSPLFICR